MVSRATTARNERPHGGQWCRKSGTLVRCQMSRFLLLLSLLVLVVTPAATAGPSAKTKPTTREFDRIQAAGRAALNKLGLVDARNCSRTSLRCIDSATDAEITVFVRAVAVERAVARTLVRGNCKTAMLRRATAYEKHASDVRKARAAWHARDFQAGRRYYYADFARGGQFDGAFVRYC
jgi:hypothetical protein